MSGWVRLWHEMPTDPKWRVIARRSGQSISEVIAVFTFVMVNASSNASERGRTHNLVCDDIAAALDMEEEGVEAILTAMYGKVLDDDGRLLGWEKRQPKREDSSAERAKAWREERKRTQANASKRPDIEINTEIEIDSLEAKASPPSDDGLRPDHVVQSWNDLAKRLGRPTIRDLTPERRQLLKARIAGYSIEDFRTVLGNIEQSPFLRGEKGWQGVTFDWFTKKANFQKILEGNYNG